MRKYIYRARKLLINNVLHADDTPHQIALGAALAMFVALLPLIGCQTAVAIAFAALFRANKAICVPIVWISNPFTAIPIFGAALYLGKLFWPGRSDIDHAALLAKLAPPQEGTIFGLAYWKGVMNTLLTLGAELWIGCFIVGAVAGVLTYFFARWGVSAYRERRRRRLLERTLFRTQCRQARLARQTEPTA